MRLGSELNYVGLVRLQRRVGQEVVAASLLTVRRSEHELHPTSVAARGWSGDARGPGFDAHAPGSSLQAEVGRQWKPGPGGGHSGVDRCLHAWLNLAGTLPEAAWTIFPRKRARCPSARPPTDRYWSRGGHRRRVHLRGLAAQRYWRSAASARGSAATEAFVRLQRLVRRRPRHWREVEKGASRREGLRVDGQNIRIGSDKKSHLGYVDEMTGRHGRDVAPVARAVWLHQEGIFPLRRR